jgi:hypothetical protein
MDLKEHIRSIIDWPKKGIVFRDITPLLQDPQTLQTAVDMLVEQFVPFKPDMVVAIGPLPTVAAYPAVAAQRLGCHIDSNSNATPGFIPTPPSLSAEYRQFHGSRGKSNCQNPRIRPPIIDNSHRFNACQGCCLTSLDPRHARLADGCDPVHEDPTRESGDS